MNQLIKIISLLTFFFLIIMMTLSRSYSLPGSTYRPVVRGTQWAISTRHSLATQAGVQIFQQGGNAIDATIAALAALGVVEPAMSGIGGEFFFWSMILRLHRMYGVLMVEVSPLRQRQLNGIKTMAIP